MGREKQSLERLETLSKENYAANLKAIVAVALFFPFMSASGTLSSALVLGVGGGMVRQGALTVGSLLAFLTYVTKFFMPLRELSQLFATYQTAAASAERIYELTQVRPDVKERAEPKELPEQIQALVEFSNVTFGYEPDKRPVLHGLDLRLEPGEVVAVVGRSGSGKTTLVKLLTRLYDPEDGTVSIDGIDIRDVRISRLRQIISVVPQDVFLFDASVAENIALGKPDASREQIEEAARMVGADTFIERLPEKYDTQVGERGSRLSGGQRQLVSFARALVAGSPILVLDEATSSVDAETEARLQRAMIQMFKGRTVLLIAHRFSTLETADKIAVLDKGRIIGVGEHKQLYESNALYRELYDKQSVS